MSVPTTAVPDPGYRAPSPVEAAPGVPATRERAARRRHPRLRKAGAVLGFCVGLVLGVLLALAVLFRFAGGWGVPYFHFTTERGSRCVNDLTGFTCPSLTLADVRFFGDVELPASTTVVSARYHSTHDYQLDAVLEVPPGAAKQAEAALADAYGGCQQSHPRPTAVQALSSVCVRANDTEVTESGVPDSQVYVVASGVRKDRSHLVTLSVRSR